MELEQDVHVMPATSSVSTPAMGASSALPTSYPRAAMASPTAAVEIYTVGGSGTTGLVLVRDTGR